MGRAFYRPFTKWIELALDTSTTVSLVDSEGTSLACNFVSVECLADAGQPTAIVSMHASSLASSPTVSIGESASGMLGTACPAGGGVAQLSIGLDSVTDVGLVTSGAAVSAIVTYGNVMVGNSLKDNQRPRGL